jgi:hypothetical protein
MRKSLLLMFCAIVLGAPAALAQPRLHGRIVPARVRQLPPDWDKISVEVFDFHTNRRIHGPEELSNGDRWTHIADLGATVKVVFTRQCYHTAEEGPFVVAPQNPERVFEMRRRRGHGQICRRANKGSSQKRGVTIYFPPSRGGAQSVPDAIETEGGVIAPADAEPEEDVSVPPTAAELQAMLEREAGLARQTGQTDTFIYNFEADRLAYRDVKELVAVIEAFEQRPLNADVLDRKRQEVYRRIIAAEFGLASAPSPNEFLEIIQDTTVSTGVRGSAVNALLASRLDPETRERALNLFRAYSQAPSSDFLVNAMVARSRLGTDADKAAILRWARGGESAELQEASLKAVRLLAIIEGTGEWAAGRWISKQVVEGHVGAEVKAAAVQMFRPFARRGDPLVVRTLTDVLEDKKEDLLVRIEAARALGVDNLEQVRPVRAKLNSVANRQDTPEELRGAIRATLAGRL